jgi:hypothetical protein
MEGQMRSELLLLLLLLPIARRRENNANPTWERCARISSCLNKLPMKQHSAHTDKGETEVGGANDPPEQREPTRLRILPENLTLNVVTPEIFWPP